MNALHPISGMTVRSGAHSVTQMMTSKINLLLPQFSHC
jgi:hypothetical protein